MRLRLLRAVCLLLAGGIASASALRAQRAAPACTLTTDELRPIVLRDGRFGVVVPLEMVAKGDSVLLLGLAYTLDPAGDAIPPASDVRSLAGFLLTHGRRVATPIPKPRGMPTARYFRTRATGKGWESVFFIPDRDTVIGARFLDSGTLWYARLNGRRWNGLERIAHVDSAIVSRPASSDLISHAGMPRFAVGLGSPAQPFSTGGLLIFRRLRPNKWVVDTIQVRGPSLTITTPVVSSSATAPSFFPVAGIWEGGDFFPGSMLAVDAAAPTSWRVVRRSVGSSMNEPTEVMVGDTMHTIWSEQAWNGRRGSSWYQALDPTRANDPLAGRQLAEGITRVQLFGMPEDGRIRPVLIYQTPSSVDSAEVAVVANGEPVAIGRIAFPYAFQTNGVASGDRSLILATMPRLFPGEVPLPSRTLGVRVDCSGATGTSTGGRHEAHLESAGARRSAGSHRLRR